MFASSTHRAFKSIPQGGFFDRHPILVPGTIFFVGWIPYLVIFFRRTIAFGGLGEPYPVDSAVYWVLFAIQLGVCVISHSLTIRTIVRLYAPRWLIWGSVAFYALSPAWGAMTAADIRHPLFAAVFCVFVSSSVFALYSQCPARWLWVQLAGGAFCVCLLRSNGAWAVIPTLVAIFGVKGWQWMRAARSSSSAEGRASMQGTPAKSRESHWADACAAFLVLAAVCLLWFFAAWSGWGLPLGEPSFGQGSASVAVPPVPSWGANLTGTHDMAGILSFSDISANSLFAGVAQQAALLIFGFQCLPVENLTFSWAAYLILFGAFAGFGICVSMRRRDPRPLIIGLPMVIVIVFMAWVPADVTLRYLMPILAAQPMFFGSCFATHLDAKGTVRSTASLDPVPSEPSP